MTGWLNSQLLGTREKLLHHRAKPNGDATAEQQSTISATTPFDSARLFRNLLYQCEGYPTLYHHRGGFYGWNGAAYPEIEELEIRARLYDFLDQSVELDKKGSPRRFKPNKSRVANILDGLLAAAYLPGSIEPPAWLKSRPLDPHDIIACRNGLLYLPDRTLLTHSPALFTYNSVDFDYAATAPPPSQWLRFLDQLWLGDAESIDTLQEIFGLMMTGDTRHQKAFLLVGPKRSGKGVIARVLVGLVGKANCVSPTLTSLGGQFGLQPLIGKLVAIISDARLGTKADQHAIVEAFLRVTGEDHITADRKNRAAWNGQLAVRFLVISNELPRLTDTSGALASRFIILRLVNSFYGREDQTLTDKLIAERPGIFNWSLDGLQRLKARGHFLQPPSAAAAVQELEDLASPIGAFIRERCEVGGAYSVGVEPLYEAWRKWCEQQGRDHPGTKQTFGRDLRAVLPALGDGRPREGSDRYRIYTGIRLRF
ncbi:MAG TPA: phage/plasmid primase, P4 family [Steroidobacteraceae bacterium]|nr:phage/plasmid primase, P4 family [Steroidobacteraceae bacterium]